MKLKLTILIILNTLYFFCFGETQILEFTNKPVIDVLIVLADLSGRNIITDGSVTGECSYYFSTDNLDRALNTFLKSQNLYAYETDGVINISRVDIKIFDNSEIGITCKDVDIKLILEKISETTGKTILFDRLPPETISLNIERMKLKSVLDIAIKKFPGFIIESDNSYYYIKQEGTTTENQETATKGITFNSDGSYSIELEKVRLSQVLREFFTKTESEFSLQGRNDNIISRLFYKNKSKEEMLTLILEEGSCDYTLSNGIYYIFDINRNDIANRHSGVDVIHLENILVKDLLKIIPPGFIAGNNIKSDEERNSIIIYGTNIKREPILNFIKLVDRDSSRRARWITLNFITSESFKHILEKSYSREQIIDIDEKSFLMLLTDNEFNKVEELKIEMDTPPESYLVTLKYIKSEQLLESLPKSVRAEQLIKTPDPSLLYYYGERDAYNLFLKDLEKMDKPVPQIKYKVLVIQNTLGDDSDFGLSVRGHSENNGDITLPEGEWNSFTGSLGALLSMDFNVLSVFGPLFSFGLNASLSSNRANILVDTTLQALSGKSVSFQNTTTSRFYQTTVDSEGNVESGETQEVSWGIILDIEGWTSGDGMITINIESTLSDETGDSSTNSGIPSTTEKIVSTEVRTREGVPVVVGGLISSKKESLQDKTPILGDIPLLGFLFRRSIEMETRSEFTIYLLPYIVNDPGDNLDLKMERAYKEFL